MKENGAMINKMVKVKRHTLQEIFTSVSKLTEGKMVMGL